jgi:autophagy-related protein 9
MAGSMYLSRLARFKNQKPNMNSTGIEEEDGQAQSDSIQDGMLQSSYSSSHHPGAYLSSSAAAFPSTSQFVPNAMNSSPPDRNGPDYNDTETSSPMRLNQYGVPDIIPSNLGESYEESQRWNTRMLQEEEEGETSNRGEGMIGLLNQFYDLNNNPTV